MIPAPAEAGRSIRSAAAETNKTQQSHLTPILNLGFIYEMNASGHPFIFFEMRRP